MSLSGDLCLGTVDAIVDHFGLDEVHGDGGGPRLTLTSQMVPDDSVGSMRVWSKPQTVDLVYVGMTVDMIGLDSHMIFAFTPLGSPVPHFTLDSVMNAPFFAFHLDLVPKVDLGANLAYMDHCFTPLTDIRIETQAIEGLEPANISPRQWALMSEWMIVQRADEDAFSKIKVGVDAYRDHWFGLADRGVPDELLDGLTHADLARRDVANRAAIFNPDVDHVWARVTQLVGEEQSERVRMTLATPGALIG